MLDPYVTHLGNPIWAIPYGTHAEPGCIPHMGIMWVAHMRSIRACLLGRRPRLFGSFIK